MKIKTEITSWNDLIDLTEKMWDNSPAYLSAKKHIAIIIHKAEEWGIPVVKVTSISNLRDIIAPARRAIDRGDRDQLESLLVMAGSMTIVELRNAVRDRREPVLVTHFVDGYTSLYRMALTERQFELAKNALARVVAFEVADG